MSNEYTPITETVRTRYIQHGNQGVVINGAEFDRWLAAHDAEVAAKTLEDAAHEFNPGAMHQQPGVLPSEDFETKMDWMEHLGEMWLHARAAGIREGAK